MKTLEEDILGLLYDCCYGKTKVELGMGGNFESSKISITHFEKQIGKILKKYEIKKRNLTEVEHPGREK